MRFLAGMIFGIVAWAAPASAQVLWQNVNVGMSVEQIRAAQPSATVPAEPSTLYGGAVCALQLRDYAVQGSAFNVCFYMKNGGLIQVTMSAQRPSRTSFDSFAVLLRSRYGAEVSPNAPACREIGSMTSCDVDWLLPSGVNVNLLFMQVGRSEPLMNINYQVRLRREGDRL